MRPFLLQRIKTQVLLLIKQKAILTIISQLLGSSNSWHRTVTVREKEAQWFQLIPEKEVTETYYDIRVIVIGTGIGGGVVAGDDLFDTYSRIGKNAKRVSWLLSSFPFSLLERYSSFLAMARIGGQQNDTFLFALFQKD